jgi:hypothetical protein
MNPLLQMQLPSGLAPGTKLRHYKGGVYEVVGACVIESTLETGVLYRPLQGDAQSLTWMRPAFAFFEKIQTDQGEQARFVVIAS